MLAVPLDNRNGDLPLQPTFLPLLRQPRPAHLGTRIDSALEGDRRKLESAGDRARAGRVRPRRAQIVRPAADSTGAAVALTEAGVYSLYDGRVAGEPVAVVAVEPSTG